MLAELPKYYLARKLITWPWVAGFFQAEGTTSIISYSEKNERWNGQIAIVQKEQDILMDIKSFLVSQGLKAGVSKGRNSYNLFTSSFDSRQSFIQEVYPYLLGDKRERISQWNIQTVHNLPQERKSLNWDFITGFWEGDGYAQVLERNASAVTLHFGQKNPEILEKIRDFIGRGSIHSPYDSNNKVYRLHVTSGLSTISEDKNRWEKPLAVKLLEHCRSQKRIEQLLKACTESDLINA